MMLSSRFSFCAALLSLLASASADQSLRQLNPDLSSNYVVKTCLADGIGQPCTGNTSLQPVSDLRLTEQKAGTNCEETEGQRGSITYTDLILPTQSSPDKVLLVEVETLVPGQDSSQGFFVRPTRLTRYWGKPTVASKKASFYLAETGQFSVEFASDSIWKSKPDVTTFDGLMIFVNPEIDIPTSNVITITANSNRVAEDLGPNQNYVFKADINYDWGADHVFKVHDNTNVYFEKGAYVRARIVQTQKKVKNVLLKGYGTLDVHYDLEYDEIGISDDATRQNVGIYGKNIQVMGLTLLNTNPTCGLFGYCLNINANWSPLTNGNEPFDVYELQAGNPPYSFQPAHCQQNNMDDTPNTDFTNCPTSHADGQHVSYVKCMTWQLGHDGLNAGKWGTIEKSFVRTVDDAIKPWDSHGIYKDITIWQLALGWPINFGWWNWNQPDEGTVVDSIYVIHNHNWITSPQWPETASGQCTVGGIYGSGALKKGYRLSNIFVETAASCAVGLEISNDAYSKHLTPDGCVANIEDTRIEGMYFDEEFYKTGGYTNFLQGERNPASGCTGERRGKIKDMVISGSVAGRPLSRADFNVHDNTVPRLTFQNPPSDPHPSAPHYQKYEQSRFSGTEIGNPIEVLSSTQCLDRCQQDWSCDCVVHNPSTSMCSKRKNCNPSQFTASSNNDVYVRLFGTTSTPEPTTAPVPAPTAAPTANPTAAPTAAPTASPTANPTTAPVPAPTTAPVPAPTTAPVPDPTVAPTATPTTTPTTTPTATPTTAPVPAPTTAPVPDPTAAPTASPTASPTTAPVPAPTTAPVPAPTTAPVPDPTAAPTASPTTAPVPAPTLAPVPAPIPSPQCSDSPDLAYQGYAWKNCNWVAKKYWQRCEFFHEGTQIYDVCPDACRECTCVDDETFAFKRDPNKNCDWVGARKSRCNKTYKTHTLDYFCPVACEACG